MTPEITLSPACIADGEELVAANVASEALHHPWVSPCKTPQAFASWLMGLPSTNSVSLIARAAENGRIVGVVNLSQVVYGAFRSAYLSYYGMVTFSGRGLMTRAVHDAIRYAFEDMHLHRVEANIQPGNTRSIALVQRLGFRKEGFSPEYLKIGDEWRDHERWALLAREFRVD